MNYNLIDKNVSNLWGEELTSIYREYGYSYSSIQKWLYTFNI